MPLIIENSAQQHYLDSISYRSVNPAQNLVQALRFLSDAAAEFKIPLDWPEEKVDSFGLPIWQNCAYEKIEKILKENTQLAKKIEEKIIAAEQSENFNPFYLQRLRWVHTDGTTHEGYCLSNACFFSTTTQELIEFTTPEAIEVANTFQWFHLEGLAPSPLWNNVLHLIHKKFWPRDLSAFVIGNQINLVTQIFTTYLEEINKKPAMSRSYEQCSIQNPVSPLNTQAGSSSATSQADSSSLTSQSCSGGASQPHPLYPAKL